MVTYSDQITMSDFRFIMTHDGETRWMDSQVHLTPRKQTQTKYRNQMDDINIEEVQPILILFVINYKEYFLLHISGQTTARFLVI